MPRVLGINLLAALAAAIVIYFIGYIIFGVLAGEFWMRETLIDHGLLARADAASLHADKLMPMSEKIPGMMAPGLAYGIGFLVSLATAIGLAGVLALVKPQALATALLTGFVLWFGFGVTTLAYDVIYSSNSPGVFLLQSGHLLLDFLAGSAVIFLIDGRALARRTPR